MQHMKMHPQNARIHNIICVIRVLFVFFTLNQLSSFCFHSGASSIQWFNFTIHRASDPDAGVNGEISYSLSARSAADYGRLFSVDSRTGRISQRIAIDYEQHRDPITLHVVADDRGDGTVPATARVVVNVRDVNDHTPHIRFETTGSGSDVMSLRVTEHGATGEFLAHMSVEDLDSGNAGRVHCTMPSSHFTIIRMYPNEYKVCSTLL